MPQVPLELTDYIIDFLYKDARTLASCAVVCRAWTPASRFHLFRSIVLQDHTFTSSFQRLLRLSPDLGYYVRELTIAKFVTASEVFVPAKPPTPSINDALPEVFRQLPHLRSLTLAHMDLKSVTDLSALHHPTLSSLSLSYCQFADFADLVDLANAFPRLADLAIAGLTWVSESRPPTPRAIPSLRRLALGRDTDSERLFDWFVAAGLHESVTHLEARCASERDTDLVGPFVKLAGPVLRELDLDWSFTGDKTIGLPVTMSLAGCAALDSLRLQFPIHYSTTLPWVVALLETIDSAAAAAAAAVVSASPHSAPCSAPATVRTLAFEVRLLGSVDALDWDGLNKVLTTAPSYRALDAFRIGVNLWPGVHKDVAEVEGVVRERLAPLEKKGILRFGNL
ncbi:hypothetical protein PYCCODRAFT_1466940 [Trametes coccinea BRFM310]|uniref:F-box domain-containing protein n=1 Tax=Trametes coccinea (strain BRFM310) TaxID=1353009 RepID=A0A1Y2IR38_TRAC3|nr:hypothetical protein PYCCODRAFT_1466940 [Trametes coccinea BRFM310]